MHPDGHPSQEPSLSTQEAVSVSAPRSHPAGGRQRAVPPAADPLWLRGALTGISGSEELFPAPHTPMNVVPGGTCSPSTPQRSQPHGKGPFQAHSSSQPLSQAWPFSATGCPWGLPASLLPFPGLPSHCCRELSAPRALPVGQMAIKVSPGQLSPPCGLLKPQPGWPHPLGHTFISSSALKELHWAKPSCPGPGVNPE